MSIYLQNNFRVSDNVCKKNLSTCTRMVKLFTLHLYIGTEYNEILREIKLMKTSKFL